MSTATLLEPRELRQEFPIDGDALYEVVNGQYVELPPMNALSSILASDLYFFMTSHARQHKQGKAVCETVFILDPEVDLRRRPDVAFVSIDRWPLDGPIPRSGDWLVCPDLAVEVISPHDPFESVFEKLMITSPMASVRSGSCCRGRRRSLCSPRRVNRTS